MEFMSPVGRLVQGSVLEGRTTDGQGKPLVVKTGPRAGQPTTQFFIAVAFKKTQAAWWMEDAATPGSTFWASLYNTGRQGYPQHFGPDGSCKHPRFAFKVMDGDGTDNDGNPNSQKEGFAGHWVVKFGSSFAPKAWMNGAYTVDPQAIKRGHFVRVIGTIEPNIGSDVPGVYVNHNGVEFIAYGQEIVSGPNVGAMFAQAARPVALPEGATMVPPTPTVSAMPAGMQPPPQMPAMPGAVHQYAPVQPVAPVPLSGPATLPQMPASMPAPGGIQPNHGFVQNVIGAPQMPAMPAPVAAPVYQMTAKAQGNTREALNAGGWTDDMMIAQGIMVRVG